MPIPVAASSRSSPWTAATYGVPAPAFAPTAATSSPGACAPTSPSSRSHICPMPSRSPARTSSLGSTLASIAVNRLTRSLRADASISSAPS